MKYLVESVPAREASLNAQKKTVLGDGTRGRGVRQRVRLPSRWDEMTGEG